MTEKKLPFDKAKIEAIARAHPTPFHIYDEAAILANARSMHASLSNVRGFRNFFAVKALPNPFVLKILAAQGMGADCSSLPELMLAEAAGLRGESIMFSSNDTPAEEYRYAKKLGAIVNLDDITHIEFLERNGGLPELVSCRFNPGPLKGGNAIIGKPEEAKYGFTRDQLFEGYAALKAKGVKRFGLHAMVASNELDPNYFIDTARLLFELAADLHDKLGINFDFINLGGGIGIPYKPEQTAVPLGVVAAGVGRAYDELIRPRGLDPLKVYLECGRVVTGPYGYLVTRAIHRKDTYRKYVGTDACMANLMRPALYGAYHHITALGKEHSPKTEVYDVVGSLCENNDKFAIQRELPPIEVGDFLAIHDTGAHGHAMGFNYNGKLRSAELLLRTDGSVVEIRRAETADDYFATLDFKALEAFRG
jgi:diaminopimelate decarboxylase